LLALIELIGQSFGQPVLLCRPGFVEGAPAAAGGSLPSGG
jgi:hypothetical protein